MSRQDRTRWDERHRRAGPPRSGDHGPPSAFEDIAGLVPSRGLAIDLACGTGTGSVWLARRGMSVLGLDFSEVAIGMAREHAAVAGVGDRCTFEVTDLDHGLPTGAPADLVMCHLFWDPDLVPEMMDRLRPGGMLAIAVLSEVGDRPGPFRAKPGALTTALAMLDIVSHHEAAGVASALAVR